MKTKMLIAALMGAFTMTAFAQSPAPMASASTTRADYKAEKDRIDANYKSAKDKCKALSANAKDICQAEAKGENEIAEAQLKAQQKPSTKADIDVRLARAEATYMVAKEKCDDLKGNPKDVCVKEAKAAYTTSKANAKVAMAADKVVTGVTPPVKAPEAMADAKRSANDDKRNAEYKVAAEKCDALAGQSKDNCVAQAKLKFGK